MGIELANPLIVGACNLTANMDTIKRIEDSGAGALVIKSLFEEQIQLKNLQMDQQLHMYDDWHAEMTSIFPEMKDAGPEEHLTWVRKAKESVKIPVIASLNAVNRETWVEYAKQLEQTKADGLELNFFATPTDSAVTAKDIEDEQVSILKDVKKAVKIPISVKLSSFYTNPVNFVKRLDDTGVNGFVLFNRFFDPSLDIEKEKSDFPFNLSHPNDHRLALRYTGLLSGKVKGSLCASHGIHAGAHAIEVLLSGADVFQVVSTLYRNSVGTVKVILDEISAWMDRKGYTSLDGFKGKLNADNNPDKFTYKRAQYVKLLMHPDSFMVRPKTI
jgi:dihydroorotate dehydrogenase (fumarate)